MKDLILLSILNYYDVHLILNLIVNFNEVVYLKLILPKFDKNLWVRWGFVGCPMCVRWVFGGGSLWCRWGFNEDF